MRKIQYSLITICIICISYLSKADNTLWEWGYQMVSYPMQIGNDNNWKAIACGYDLTMAINNDGSLWAWGRNLWGKLGDGTTLDRWRPVRIGADFDWQIISCGHDHTMAIKSDGSLWGWGYGEIGDGTTIRSQPIEIIPGSTWKTVACGSRHTIAIRSDGTLWGWGQNIEGQLGIGTTDPKKSFPTQIGTDNDWNAVSCGGFHTVALKADGSLWIWGYNNHGQLGDGSNTYRISPYRLGADNDWQKIACGRMHTFAIKTDGTLWAWGYNYAGQLGDGTFVDKYTPTAIGPDTDWDMIKGYEYHTIALKTDRSIWACGGYAYLGDGSSTFINVFTDVSHSINWKFITCGDSRTFAIATDGTLWAWGQTINGSLGLLFDVPANYSNSTDWNTASSGYAHTLAVKGDGTLWGKGYNASGQLGDNTLISKESYTQIGISNDWNYVHCKWNSSFAIKNDGSLWAWGENMDGQLGVGDNYSRKAPSRVGNANDWQSVSCSEYHTMGIKFDGSLWAWGGNGSGQFGDGRTTGSKEPIRIGTSTDWRYITCGYSYTFGIKNDGTLWGWGFNNYGQIGDGTNFNRNIPVQIGNYSDWLQVSCGNMHTMGIRSDGTLWGWGYNYYGQIGDGTNTNRLAPLQIGNDNNWMQVVCGYFHTLAMKSDGSIWAWGNNWYGQLGNGTRIDSNIPIQISTGSINSVLEAGYYNSILLKHINNHLPVAICKNVTVQTYQNNCYADVTIDNGSYDPDEGDEISLIQDPPGPYPLGTTTVTLTATDSKGLTSNCSSTVTVEDLIPPLVVCNISEQNLTLNDGFCSYTKMGTDWDASATDNCSSTLSLSYNLSGATTGTGNSLNGTNFNPGNTTVKWSASDESGNLGEYSFNVSVSYSSATVSVYGVLHGTGPGTNPSTRKSALELDLKVFDMSDISGGPREYGNIWNNYTPLSSSEVIISSGELASFGGGEAYKYNIALPSGNCITSTGYLIIGKANIDGTELYTGASTGVLQTGSTLNKYLQVIKKDNGKKVPAITTVVNGSLLLIAEPAYIEFTEADEIFPIICESAEGDWGVTITLEPPEGFVSSPGSLSTEVTTNVINAVQFTVKDIGSSWTHTKVTHRIKHKGKDIELITKPGMIDKQKKKKEVEDCEQETTSFVDELSVRLKQNYPNPFAQLTEIQYFVSQREHATLLLTDINGRVIANLIDKYVSPGWNTLIVNGSGLTTGTYILRLESMGKAAMMKIVKMD